MTRKLMIAAVSAAVLAGSLGTAALARPGDKGGIPPMARPGVYVFMLKNFDANKDGKVSAEEAKAGAGTLFTTIDTDKDGNLTPKEMRTWRQAKMAEMRKAMGPEAGDDAMGGPDDGDAAGKPGKHHDGMKGKRHHHGKGHHGMMGGGMMRMLDGDENGQVSKAEAEAAADKAFTQMDTNKDGVVSIDDFPG